MADPGDVVCSWPQMFLRVRADGRNLMAAGPSCAVEGGLPQIPEMCYSSSNSRPPSGRQVVLVRSITVEPLFV